MLIGWVCGVYFQSALPEQNFLAVFAKIVIGFFVIAFWYMNGTALNDYEDYEIDQVNLKGDRFRPLVTGLSSKGELLLAAKIYAACTVIFAFLLSWQQAALCMVLLALNYVYSVKPFQVSRRGGLAPLLLPLGYVVLTFATGYGLSGWGYTIEAFIILVALYIHFLSRIILKDYRDVKGDKKFGKITYLIKHGNRKVCLISASSAVVSSVTFINVLDAGYFLFPIIVLTSYAVSMLFNLSMANTWKLQKPLLAAFGRAMTGVTVSFLMAVASFVWDFSRLDNIIIAFAISLIYTWSALQAYNHNVHPAEPGRI